MLEIIVHETMHILGLSSSLFSNFYNHDTQSYYNYDDIVIK
jgi:hypothetical protein